MLEKIREIISEYAEVDINEITEETSLGTDLGFSSIDIVNIAVALEDEFNIILDENEIVNFHCLGDLIKYIEENQK